MNIELSRPDIELIDKALQEWETAPTGSAIMGAAFGMIFARGESQRDEEKGRIEKQMEKASSEVTERRIASTMLRAKLLKGLNDISVSEFAAQQSTTP